MPTFAAFLRQNMPECGQIWLLATTIKNAKTGDVSDERTSSCEKRIFKRPYFYDKGALIFYNIIGIDYGISFYIRIGV